MTNNLTKYRQNLVPFNDFRREMDRLFEDFWQTPSLINPESSFIPACDIEDLDKCYLFTVEAPGMKKEDIKIEVKNNIISIAGERKEEKNKKSKGTYYSERSYGQFKRSFMLPDNVNPDRIEANYKDGVLQIAVPKMEGAQSKQVKISEGGTFSHLLEGEKKAEENKESPHSTKRAS
jgi:HSP20 family protein